MGPLNLNYMELFQVSIVTYLALDYRISRDWEAAFSIGDCED